MIERLNLLKIWLLEINKEGKCRLRDRLIKFKRKEIELKSLEKSRREKRLKLKNKKLRNTLIYKYKRSNKEIILIRQLISKRLFILTRMSKSLKTMRKLKRTIISVI